MWTLCNNGMKHLQDAYGRRKTTFTQAATVLTARLWTVHSRRVTCGIHVGGDKCVLNFSCKTLKKGKPEHVDTELH
jgi:hypothetical protein